MTAFMSLAAHTYDTCIKKQFWKLSQE